MVEVDAAGSSASGRCGVVRWLARRVAERVRQAGERRGGREPADGLLLLTAGSSHGYREQQEEEDGGAAVTRDAIRTEGSRRCVGAKGHEVSVCWGKDRIFQCVGGKNPV